MSSASGGSGWNLITLPARSCQALSGPESWPAEAPLPYMDWAFFRKNVLPLAFCGSLGLELQPPEVGGPRGHGSRIECPALQSALPGQQENMVREFTTDLPGILSPPPRTRVCTCMLL